MKNKKNHLRFEFVPDKISDLTNMIVWSGMVIVDRFELIGMFDDVEQDELIMKYNKGETLEGVR